ncbi:MAG: PepSY-associated TM helix domain-containing protein [Halopseudomonas sp.]|uniref:PepSY-associated TM helix domain-containing protein n=1 Tax=Halopseudomonas sp. TaxID=2901191 RepID=UPI00300197FC
MARQASLTQSMSGLHTWAGLILGWLLFAIFLTGTLAVFDEELNWWMQPELRDSGLDQTSAVQVAEDWLRTRHPDASAWNIGLPTERGPDLSVSAGEQRRGQRTIIDPGSGEVVQPRETLGGNFFFRFHYTLHMPRSIGIWVVGFAAMAMLVTSISGIIIHKKIFKDFFTFRPAKGQRSWLDGHNASAVLLLPFHLMITYTGLAIFFLIYMPAATDALYGGDRQAMFRELRPGAEQQQERGGRPGEGGRAARVAAPATMLPLDTFIARGEAYYGVGMLGSLSVSNPDRANAQVEVRPVLGSRLELTKGESLSFNAVTGESLAVPTPTRATLLTQKVMAGLHFAQFGGYAMRWIYFICGLISCAMIASGLVLYTVKRRRQAKSRTRWLRQAEWLNVAVVSGLMLACTSLLWGNRLLPAALDARETWELRVFFGSWLLALLHARLRAPLRAWTDQLGLAGVLLLALPLLDLLRASESLDSLRLGVDVSAAVMGLLLLWASFRVANRPAVAEKPARVRPATTGVAS